ncbi:hypothetical protein MSKU15_1271 [Komagataeibacter diospyri]|uniref:hypothetical protein n=1 Tax=Komagataeibacter diospyri TaxID=1932662 RepID=UPI00113C9E1B|nr:hypothetical protein [Komagataeibacter diospyri]GCE89670.1 hypothetical protein MSKU15_1271 [Komagataeibacter diospyri]
MSYYSVAPEIMLRSVLSSIESALREAPIEQVAQIRINLRLTDGKEKQFGIMQQPYLTDRLTPSPK